MVTLLQSTQVHIPLLGQCCLFNRSASCLWLLSFLLNITGQIPSSHPPSLPTPTSFSFPAISSHKELLLAFLKCLNCERLLNKLKRSVPGGRGESTAGYKLGVHGWRSQGCAAAWLEAPRSRKRLRGPVQPSVHECVWVQMQLTGSCWLCRMT